MTHWTKQRLRRFLLAAALLLVSLDTAMGQPSAQEWAELGEAELKRGERGGPDAPKHFDKAIEALEASLALEPGSPFAIHTLASVYMRTGRTEDAAEVLTGGIAARPEAALLRAKLGYVFRYAGMMETSVAEYRRSEELDPSLDNRITSERQVIKALIYSGRCDEAFDAYASILEWLSELGRSPDEKIQFYQGLGYLYAGDVPTAVRMFDASVATDPNSLWSKFARAYKYGALEERTQLTALADELAEDNVSDGERRYRLAHLYSMAGRPEVALGHLEASAHSGFFNFPYTKEDRLLQNIHQSEEFERILGFIEQRHEAFLERFATNDDVDRRSFHDLDDGAGDERGVRNEPN